MSKRPKNDFIAISLHSRPFRGLTIVFVSAFLIAGCTRVAGRTPNEIRVFVESSPASLDPRQSFDAIGQRLEMLAFHALTNLDADLNPMPDLSEKWRYENGGKRAVFTLRTDLKDDAGVPITPTRVVRCLRNYLITEPKSPQVAGFPTVRDITLEKNEAIFTLAEPDPYLPRNLSVIRYFTVAGDPDEPCRPPKLGERLVTNGTYSIDTYPDHFDRGEILYRSREAGAPNLVFELSGDETSRLLKLVNHEGDVVLNSFTPSKHDWISEGGKHGFARVDRDGTNAQYLAFNLRDPVLAKLPVRLAIAHAIDRDAIVRYKIRNEAAPASSFLSPSLPEGMPPRAFAYDPAESERLLDQAGYPRGKNGVRLTLKQKTTTSGEGPEIVQIFREMLAKIGIQLELDPVEPAVFFASVRKGNFQLYMSRWVGIADGSIFERTLRTGAKDNRVGYADKTMDEWLDEAQRELDPAKRRDLLVRVQERMLEQIPYFPLWHWTNTLIVRDTIVLPKTNELSLSGSYFPLKDLRFKVKP